MPLGHRLPECHPLRTGPHGVRRVLDVGAVNELPVAREDRGAHAEPGVRAVRGGLGGCGARVQRVELLAGQAVGRADLGDGGGGGGLEGFRRHVVFLPLLS